MAEIIYLNGSLVPRPEARVSVYDHGFLYGYGLFETMRSYHGKIFLLERHVKRLLLAAEQIGLGQALTGIDLGRACVDTLKANHLEDARLRLTVSRGEVEGFPGKGNSQPTVVVTARRYVPLAEEKYRLGYKADISSLRRCGHSPLSGMKSTSYLVSLLARLEAGKSGLDEALLLNERGFIAEGSVSNVFFVKASGLVTPSTESGILPGITRELVIELAGESGISVNEREVKPPDLEQFDEAFLTNSVIEIMPLVSVQDGSGRVISIGQGKPGEVTLRLMSAYKDRVERETRQT